MLFAQLRFRTPTDGGGSTQQRVFALQKLVRKDVQGRTSLRCFNPLKQVWILEELTLARFLVKQF